MLKTPITPGSLESRFNEMLGQLRRLIRADGAAGLLLTVAVWALVSLGLDWALELPWMARALILVLLGLLLLRAVVVLGMRLRRQVSERTLAVSVERSSPELEGHLLNAIGFEGSLADTKLKGSSQLETVLLRRALVESERAARSIPFGSGLDYRPFYRRVLFTAAATALLLAMSFAFPGFTGLWVQRNLLLLDKAYPRDTTLVLDRLESVWHCARGESVPLLGKADGKIPAEITVWMKGASGTRRASFIPGANGRLAFTFPEVVEPFDFYLRGGDGRTETRSIEVHDRPRVLAVSFALIFPEYLARPPETQENSARDLVIPAGTTVAFRAKADMPLKGGWVKWEKDERQSLAPAGTEGEGPSTIEHRFTPARGGSLDLAVVDQAWGLESRPPSRVRVEVRPDAPPKITLALKQKARVVTPVGAVDYKVEGKDDHGFSRLGLETAVAASAADPRLEKSAFEGIPPRQPDVTHQAVLELEPLHLEPGMRITLTAEGADNDGIAGPKPARSNSETLAVVGPEEFREEMARARTAARRELEDALQAEERIAVELASAAGAEESPDPSNPPSNSSDPSSPSKSSKSTRSSSSAKSSKSSKSSTGSDPSKSSESAESAESAESEKSSDSKSESGEPPSRSSGRKDAKSADAAKSAVAKSSEGKSAGSKASDSKSSESKESEDASPAPEGAPADANPPRPAPSPSAAKSAALSRSQAESGRRVARAARELRDVADSLEQNKMMDDTERNRFDAEVLAPLDELGEERFPRTSQQIAGIEKSEDPRKESSRAQAEVEQIQESLKNILDRLSDTEDFSDILHRLEGVLQLHRKAMDSTREKTGPPPGPAGKDPGQRKEDL